MTEAEVRATVRILELKAELLRLTTLRDDRERKAQLRLRNGTTDAYRAGTREDGMPEYVDTERISAVCVELASVARHNR